MREFKKIDDLLNSDFIVKEKLENLLELAEIDKENLSKSQMVDEILYNTVLGLDEILNILFTEFELRRILGMVDKDNEIDPAFYRKSNIIGILLKLLPTKKKRKIETVIEEAIDEDQIYQRPIIYFLTLMVPDGRAVFSFNFRPIEIGDLTMFTSAINGISILLEELTKRDRLENIELSTKGKKETDLELLFEYGEMELNYQNNNNLIGILLVNKESEEIRKFLKDFIKCFEEEYKDYFFPQWNGRISDFYDAKHMVYKLFSEYIDF
ncbi:MAG: hypothetical protein GF329_18965 [Candidatus Lokiarchaeota archaeon]|nr:hypothetical protein [Candidatus Lokiarchaeota archaeon]